MKDVESPKKYSVYDLLVKLANADGRYRREIFGNKEDNFYLVTKRRRDTRFSTFLNFFDDLGYEIHVIKKNDPQECYTIDNFDPFKRELHVKSY